MHSFTNLSRLFVIIRNRTTINFKAGKAGLLATVFWCAVVSNISNHAHDNSVSGQFVRESFDLLDVDFR